MGTYKPPALSTARAEVHSSGERSRRRATGVSGPAPAARRCRASRFARASSSR